MIARGALGDLIFGWDSTNTDPDQGSDSDADSLAGGLGKDEVQGGAGNDVRIGGEGSDELTRGDGADQFLFQALGSIDKITDFAPSENHIALAAAVFAGMRVGAV